MLLQLVEWEEEPARRALERDLSELMDLYVDRPLKEIRMEAVLEQLLRLISLHRLRLPWERYLMVKALATTEGLGRILDPDFDMTARAAPFVRRLKTDRLRPGRIAGEIGESMGDLVLLLREIPADIREILKQLRQGRTRIGFEHRGLEDLLFEMDRSSNRISFALVASAIIIGSSLIIQRTWAPGVRGGPPRPSRLSLAAASGLAPGGRLVRASCRRLSRRPPRRWEGSPLCFPFSHV